MKILITGASGFLGKFIYKVLRNHGDVITVSRANAEINVDLAKEIPRLPQVDLVVHAAGKAHFIPGSAEEEQAFFLVNYEGTRNLLYALAKTESLPKSFVFISTVAVYGCDTGVMINEETVLSAKDPYGKSKIQAERLIQDWCIKNGIICTILRLPLVVGENPLGNLRSMINGIKKGYYFNIGGGIAKKSMVLASDVAELIPKVAKIGGIYNLTDGFHPSFLELSSFIAKQLHKSKPINIPIWLAKIMALTGNFLGNKAPINTNKLRKIISDLTFDDSHAKNKLDWKPTAVLTKEFIISKNHNSLT